MAQRSAVETAKEHQATALETAARRLRAAHAAAFNVIPISERAYIERALAFASWDGKDAARLAQLNLELQVGCALVDEDGESQALEATPRLAAAVNSPGIGMAAFRRDSMRKHLQAIIDVRAELTARWKATPAKHRSAKELEDYMPRIIKTGSDERGHVVAIWKGQEPFGDPAWMYFPVDLGAAIKIVFDLLTDSTRPYASMLRQCQRKACGGYFLLPSKLGRGQPTNMHPECRTLWRDIERHQRKNRRSQ